MSITGMVSTSKPTNRAFVGGATQSFDMPPTVDSSSSVAYYPLTLCDDMSQGSNLVKAWIVEGLLDIEKVTSALDRVVAKWPMLAGRMEVTGRKVC
jgi:hypothetical protein